jgi:hypothetical protein
MEEIINIDGDVDKDYGRNIFKEYEDYLIVNCGKFCKINKH